MRKQDEAGSMPFFLGLTTQLANPKVMAFFGSIFVALLPVNSPTWVHIATIAIVFCVEMAWYTLISLFFSNAGMRHLYFRTKIWIDRGMAGALGAIGIGLALRASQSMDA
jgi:threonine/homoserine/homoserine lactone efflux protein